ncbi:hypothetical protein FE392_09315 [Xenorhabdus sp. 12]|uniref:Transposase n=1 Tax=Xenorhabdus santafensis TaxID=2582833 RepID=A0ABU4S9P6_9GAMM|nr:hypothetical protein [Xenorhabdus sp. 12]
MLGSDSKTLFDTKRKQVITHVFGPRRTDATCRKLI